MRAGRVERMEREEGSKRDKIESGNRRNRESREELVIVRDSYQCSSLGQSHTSSNSFVCRGSKEIERNRKKQKKQMNKRNKKEKKKDIKNASLPCEHTRLDLI